MTMQHATRNTRAWLYIWLPVIVCVAVVTRESTPAFSGAQTGHFLRPIWEAIFGPMSEAHWDIAHIIMRKAGHFFWYGLTGLSWLRAWRIHWKTWFPAPQLFKRAAGMALCCTAMVASGDELHQSFLPSRTGQMSDVAIDLCGGLVMMLILRAFIALRSRNKTQAPSS